MRPRTPLYTALTAAAGQFPLLIVLMYALVEFFPRFAAVDVMGSQWLFLSLLNCATLVYLVVCEYKAPTALLKSTPLRLLTGFLLVAAASFLVAYNVIESLVTYSRLLSAGIAWFNLCILLSNRPGLTVQAIRFIAVVLMVQSARELWGFFNALPPQASLDDLIASMRGNTGNKNFLGAGILLRIPFLLVLLHDNKRLLNGVALTGLLLSVCTLLIINSRSTYLGFLLISCLYIGFTVVRGLRERKRGLLLRPVLYTLTLLLALACTQVVFSRIGAAGKPGSYGDAGKRMASISFSNEGSSGRVRLWESALDFIGEHPLLGGGYGNWKIHSIPYEASSVRGFGIRKHVHNDYLEVTADTGIAGGLLYTGFLLSILVLGARLSLGRNKPDHVRLYASVMTLSVIGFLSDSLFNFPMERPNMFLHLLFCAAGIMAMHLRWNCKASSLHMALWPINTGLLVLTLGTTLVAVQAYRSMAVQRMVRSEWFGITKPARPPFRSADVNPRFPAIPNLNELGMPIACMKAKYLVQEGKHAAARAELDAGNAANPHLYYAEFLRTQMAIAEGDSAAALEWIRMVHRKRPANQQDFEKRYAIARGLKDNLEMESAFRLKTDVRPEASDYILHAKAMFERSGDSLAREQILRAGETVFPGKVIKDYPN
ncbi:MAG: O-antigen ligase family protein [Bacteroidota bacterium]